jgi:carbamate kinase
MRSLAPIVRNNTVTIVHGNGPQVGLLVLEGAVYEMETGLEQMRLDVLDAETEGMIGYMIEQELHPLIPHDRSMATVLTQIVVDKSDPAFQNPTKFIGPVYSKEEADALGLPVRRDGEHWRRVVPSPLPVRMLSNQLRAIQSLTRDDCVVICAGGGGIPVVEDPATGQLSGIEAVIDKDRAACLVGASLRATGLLILTDVQGVAVNFGSHEEKWIKQASPGKLENMMESFPPGSMGPKVESAIEFVKQTNGWAAIGSLKEADRILGREAGTWIEDHPDWKDYIEFYDEPSKKNPASGTPLAA